MPKRFKNDECNKIQKSKLSIFIIKCPFQVTEEGKYYLYLLFQNIFEMKTFEFLNLKIYQQKNKVKMVDDM